MQTRVYTAFAKTAGASILAYPCTLTSMDGNLASAAASGYFFQIHDKASAPSAGNVPIKSYLINSAGPANLQSLFETLGPLYLANGLAVGISTTESTYTAATATYTVFGEVEAMQQSIDDITGLITVGDTTTNVASLQVWLDGDGSFLRLFRLKITNTSAGTRYPMIFAKDTPVNGEFPFVQLPLISASSSKTFYFGTAGIHPKSDIAGVIKQGCCVVASTTATTYTAGGNDMTCEALEKNVLGQI